MRSSARTYFQFLRRRRQEYFCRTVVAPLSQRRGLVFVDDGCGLSLAPSDDHRQMNSYQAFFSIGKCTKIKGDGIGYKCQGSKLCFASRKFSLITRCAGESNWRYISIENPKSLLKHDFGISPSETETPWSLLRERILDNADTRTNSLLREFDEEFFRHYLATGLMIILEDFDVDDYNKFFSTQSENNSYLYNYIRFYTAHGDVRRLGDKKMGFKPTSVKTVMATISPRIKTPPTLNLWMTANGNARFEAVPSGWPYLSLPHGGEKSPIEVSQLVNARFGARYATTFKFEDHYYNIILALDGKRRALDEWEALGRQGKARSGISFANQRGVLLACEGVRVGAFDRLFDNAVLGEWAVLQDGRDGFVFIIDGSFDLVTNRNACAQNSLTLLNNANYLAHVKEFLEKTEREGGKFADFVARLRREGSNAKLEISVARHEELKRLMSEREQFQVTDLPALANKWLVAPLVGEEHFVGALYVMFAHLVPPENPMAKYWPRPLTFSCQGIDSFAVGDEKKWLHRDFLQCLEYKFHLSTREEFNHPLYLVDQIVCWEFDSVRARQSIRDSYGHLATIDEALVQLDQCFGFVLRDVRREDGSQDLNKEIIVVGLKALLTATFPHTKWRLPPPPPPSPSPTS